jgi:hypothetical protein
MKEKGAKKDAAKMPSLGNGPGPMRGTPPGKASLPKQGGTLRFSDNESRPNKSFKPLTPDTVQPFKKV